MTEEEAKEIIGKELEPLEYCLGHMTEMDLFDQLRVMTIISKASKDLKPLYQKYAVKDDNHTFLFKLGED